MNECIQRLCFSTGTNKYFSIVNGLTKKALDASKSNDGEIVMWKRLDHENQLWFWDKDKKDVLRNKRYPEKVMNHYQKHIRIDLKNNLLTF